MKRRIPLVGLLALLVAALWAPMAQGATKKAPTAPEKTTVMKGYSAPGTPAKYNKVYVTKFGSAKAKRILVLVPGMAAGRVIGTTIIEAVGLGILYAGLSIFLFLGPFKSVVHDVPVALVLLGLSTLPGKIPCM